LQRQPRNRASFGVEGQAKPIDEQRLHHHAHVVLRGRPRCARVDVEPLDGDPGGQSLEIGDLEGEPQVRDQRLVGSAEEGARRERITDPERKARGRRIGGSIWLDCSDVERKTRRVRCRRPLCRD
jgi:hypothetical protein